MITETTSFDAVARLACSRAGIPYDTAQTQSLTTEQWALLREEISAALRWAWESYWWEDLMHTCQVTLRADYAAGTTYAALDEVYHPDSDAYFICLQASTGNAPATWDGTEWDTNYTYWARVDEEQDVDTGDWESGVAYALGDRAHWHAADYACISAHTSSGVILPSNTTYWGRVPDFDWYCTYHGTDSRGTRRPVIGRVQRACAVDPRANLAAVEFETEPTATGIRFYNLTVARPWIRYRVRCPEFTGAVWTSSATFTTETSARAIWGA